MARKTNLNFAIVLVLTLLTLSTSSLARPIEEQANVDVFEELSVKFGGIWIHWQGVEFTVRGDGSVEFSMNSGPKDETRYETTFKLSGEHLVELSRLLQRTNWLTAPGANVQPGYTDATRIDMTLVRDGGTNDTWCHDRNPEPYLSLVNFLRRMYRQEFLLNRMVAAGDGERASAFFEISQQVRMKEGEPVAANPNYPLDLSRFVPPSVDVVGRPGDHSYETIRAALKLLGMLRAEQVRGRGVTDLTTAEQKERGKVSAITRTEHVRAAAVEALAKLGGEQARLHIRDMAESHSSWGSAVNEAIVESLLELDKKSCARLLKDMAGTVEEASWGLIRLGPTGIPFILEILEVRDALYMGQVDLIRHYIDRWEEVAKPIDPRVIEAVQKDLDYRLGLGRHWTQYHKEFLRLAGAPELPSKDARQIAEEFLAAVKADDEMAMGRRPFPSGDWRERLAKLKALPHLMQLEVKETYVDAEDNLAWSVAAAPGPANESKESVRIILNFIGGAVWRVGNIAIETPHIYERMRKRYLENHPNAKLMPARSPGALAADTGARQSEPSVWVTLLPRSPIHSAKELYLYFWSNSLIPGQVRIDSFELEIRSADDNMRVAKIGCRNMLTVHTREGEVLRWSMFRDELRENMIRRIGPLSDGEYLTAIYVNGIRCSNVGRFTVDSGVGGIEEPTLRVVPLVPAPGKKLQYFGLRAVGPAPQDSGLTNMALSFPDLVVDGVRHRVLAMNWSGPVYSLKPGQQHEEILQLTHYEPRIDLSRQHTVKAIVGKYESAPVVIGFDRSAELAWDKATVAIRSRPPQRPVLKGRVIGPDGNPGVGYSVRLYADPRNGQYIEYTDEEGKYDFPNVPTGNYQLRCRPKGNSGPTLEFGQFQIETDETAVQELSLEEKYVFSGKVTYEDGSPAAGVRIVGRWDAGEGSIFSDLKVTDEIGYYKLTAPVELAEYISLIISTSDGVPAQGSYEHIGVTGSRTDVDFVVKRREAHAAIWPERFARMGGKHPGFQPVPVPRGWSQTLLSEALCKYLKKQGEARLPGCAVDLDNGTIQLYHNTREYNIMRPGNAKRSGMPRFRDHGIGPEPDGLILTVHFSRYPGQFDRPHLIDRSPWTGFVSQVYIPDMKLYLHMDVQYGTAIDKSLLIDLCAPTRWLETILAISIYN